MISQGALTPKISVVIPTFNRAHLVADAIRSAVGQLFPPLEIIVVDDGSTDGTRQIVSSISGKIPVHYYWQPNQGHAVALNRGVATAKNEWIAFLDSDDVWYPNKLAVQVAHMEACREVPFFYCDMDYVVLDHTGTERPTTRGWDSVLIPLIFNGYPNAHAPTVLIRKAVFQQLGGFNPTLRLGVSWELFARVAHEYPIHYIPERLAKQRLHPEQTTRNMHLRAESYHRFHACMWELWKGDRVKRTILTRDTARVYADLGRHFLRTGDHAEARRCFRRSLSYGPWSLKNWRRLGISYLPGLREWYGVRKAKPAAH